MSRIVLWKGYHSSEIPSLLKQAWQDDDLTIFLPALMKDFSFLTLLPGRHVDFWGNWTDEEKRKAQSVPRQPAHYPQTPVLGLFSSGSAGGLPKLILYSKRNIEFALEGVLAFFDKKQIDHVFCYPHPFHTFGLLLGYTLAMLNDWRFTALDGKYNSHFHQKWLDNVGPGTLTLGTPTHFKDLMHYLSSQDLAAPNSYSCIVGGAPVSPQLWDHLREGLNISEPSVGYGATEASPALTHLPPGQRPQTAGDIGYAIKGVEIKTLDTEGFEFKGPNVCLAILQGHEISFPEKILLRDDLQKNADGSYTFLGRTDFTLNRGGEKFKLEEIENLLFEKLKLQATALAIPDKRLGFDLALLIDASERQESSAQREEIIQCLHDKYQIHFNGTLFLRTRQFPLNDSSKRDRKRALSKWQELLEAARKIYGTP